MLIMLVWNTNYTLRRNMKMACIYYQQKPLILVISYPLTEECGTQGPIHLRPNTANTEVNKRFPSHLHQELPVGQNTVLIREGFPEVIKHGHAIPAKRRE